MYGVPHSCCFDDGVCRCQIRQISFDIFNHNRKSTKKRAKLVIFFDIRKKNRPERRFFGVELRVGKV